MALAWALLPNETRATYVELFIVFPDALLTKFGDARTSIADIELAAIQAISLGFPNCKVKGCSFHLRQAIYRRVQQEGLRAIREPDESHSSLVSPAVVDDSTASFCSTADVVMTESAAVRRPLTDVKARALTAYFEATWLLGYFPVIL